MISNKWRIMKYLAKLYDLLSLVLSLVLTTLFEHSSGSVSTLAEFLSLRITLGNVLLLALLLLAWHNLFALCGLYDSKRLTPVAVEIYEVCKATPLAGVFLFAATRVVHVQMVNFTFLLSMWAICSMAMICGRLVARSLLVVLRRQGGNSRFLIIVGTNKRAIEFAERLTESPELGYNIVGFVDDDWEGTAHFEASGHARCCTFAGLADFLRHNVVDEAAFYLPLRSYYQHAAELASLCEHHGIAIRTDPRLFWSKRRERAALAREEDSPLAGVPGSSDEWQTVMKRFIDLMVSLSLLVVLAPVFVVVALLVHFSSEGPIFFRQTRVGLNKRQFTIYKFRTMIADAEKVQNQLLAQNEMSGPVFKIKNDPRITPLGRVLRKTSLDELPQLFNVLKGEMSLVGPRAMSLRDYKLFELDWHRRRFSVKPGITCLWQVCGRNSIPFERWMELDLQYIDKWSLWLDLKILLQTVPAVWRGTGAA
jgi:exopolysaccharide biosynthesis polyprenyl glycosylphosphotransferase